MLRSKHFFTALAALVCGIFLSMVSYADSFRVLDLSWFERSRQRAIALYDRICFKVEAVAVNALRMFGPTGVFALALTSLDSSVKTARKAWASLMHREGHYHAPGGWTRCAST